MKRRLAPAAAGALTLAATGGLFFLGAGTASATTYTYEPDPNSVGTLTFYDAQGHVVTSGSLPSDPNAPQEISAFVVGSTVVHANDQKATLYFATPSSADPSTWSKEPVNGATTFSPEPAGLPAPLNTTSLPVFAGSNDPNSGDDSLTDWSQQVPNAQTGANANIYQVRIYTSGPGQTIGSTYDSADVLVDNTAHTWTLEYPTVTSTTTTLTSSTAAPTAGTPFTLHAAVTSGVPGTVTFFEGANQIGSPVAVSGGAADSQAISPAAGGHTYTARFNPTPGFSDGSKGTAGTPSSATLNEYKDSTASPLTVQVAPATVTPPPALPEAPYAALLVLTGLGAVGALALRRKANSPS